MWNCSSFFVLAISFPQKGFCFFFTIHWPHSGLFATCSIFYEHRAFCFNFSPQSDGDIEKMLRLPCPMFLSLSLSSSFFVSGMSEYECELKIDKSNESWCLVYLLSELHKINLCTTNAWKRRLARCNLAKIVPPAPSFLVCTFHWAGVSSDSERTSIRFHANSKGNQRRILQRLVFSLFSSVLDVIVIYVCFSNLCKMCSPMIRSILYKPMSGKFARPIVGMSVVKGL